MQGYMVSPFFTNEDVNLLHCLRAIYRDCKANFSHAFYDLKCILCKDEQGDQKHILHCKVILEAFKPVDVTESNVKYDDIFSDDTRKQKVVTELFKQS